MWELNTTLFLFNIILLLAFIFILSKVFEYYYQLFDLSLFHKYTFIFIMRGFNIILFKL
jgi:hypothetical protein